MNKTHTALALVLDRSGSMASCLEPAIAATNQFLRDQKTAEGTADLTITLFDDQIEHPHIADDIHHVPGFDTTTFVPRGSTALLDAIGDTIDQLGARLAQIPEPDRPGTVILAILTDGLENASQRFDWKQINQKIRHQQNTYGWQFLFLGAGPDAIAQASQLGILNANASAFANDTVGHAASAAAYSGKVRAMRAAAHRTLDPIEHALVNEPLADLVQKEDQKRRGKD